MSLFNHEFVSVVQEVTIVFVDVSRNLSQKIAYIVIVFSLAGVILWNFLIFEIVAILDNFRQYSCFWILMKIDRIITVSF